MPNPHPCHRLTVIEAELEAILGTMKVEEGMMNKSKGFLTRHPGEDHQKKEKSQGGRKGGKKDG